MYLRFVHTVVRVVAVTVAAAASIPHKVMAT